MYHSVLPRQYWWIIPKSISNQPIYERDGSPCNCVLNHHLVFGLEQAVDVVEAVEDEADGGRSDLVVAAKVGGRGVAGRVGEDT